MTALAIHSHCDLARALVADLLARTASPSARTHVPYMRRSGSVLLSSNRTLQSSWHVVRCRSSSYVPFLQLSQLPVEAALPSALIESID